MTFVFILLFALALATSNPSPYFGVRVAKTCKSMLADSLKFAQSIPKEFHVSLTSVSKSHGSWWRYSSLSLQNIEGTLKLLNNNPTVDNCTVMPTGNILSLIKGNLFAWSLKFDFQYQHIIYRTSGKGTIEVTADSFELSQSYNRNNPSTTVHVNWKLDKMDLSQKASGELADMLKELFEEKLKPQLNLAATLILKPIDDAITKSYEQMDTVVNTTPIHVKNHVSSTVSGSFNALDYVVLNYQPEFSIENKEVKMRATSNLTNEFYKEGEQFDLEVCYNSRLFGEFLKYLVTAQEEAFNKLDIDEYPKTVGYYRGIVPSLGNRYSDDTPVTFKFQLDIARHIVYHDNNSLLLPFICTFSLKDTGSVFLVLRMDYAVAYEFLEQEGYVRASLHKAKIQAVRTVPVVDMPARLIALQLANGFASAITNYTVGGTKGFGVKIVNPEGYTYATSSLRNQELCQLYLAKTS